MPLKGPHEHLPFPSHTQGLWIHTLVAGWHGMRVALKGWKGWRFSQVRIKIGLSWNVWRSVKPVIEKSTSWPSGYQIKLALAERTKDLGQGMAGAPHVNFGLVSRLLKPIIKIPWFINLPSIAMGQQNGLLLSLTKCDSDKHRRYEIQ